MEAWIQNLKNGDWVTCERMRVYAWIFIVLWLSAIVGLLLSASGDLDVLGRPLGTDFANVWSAGHMALSGMPVDVYNPQKHYLTQQVMFHDHAVPYYGWHYPPFFLLVATALALLPYGWALAVWVGLTLPLYLGVVLGIMRSTAPLSLTISLALAFSAVPIVILHGQNGFLTAALLGTGLLFVDKRPVLAGIAFGLLVYKPQFGPLIPLVLAFSGRWTVFAAASLTVLILIGLTIAVFGVDIWSAFLANTHFTRVDVLESGAIGWGKLQSLFAALRSLGAPVLIAYVAQGLLAAGVAFTTMRLWRQPVAPALKSAGLVTGAVLVTPYVLDYDLVVLALAIAWLAGHGLKCGFLAWEKTVLVLVWGIPLIARVTATAIDIPVGFFSVLVFHALILRRARFEVSGS